MGQVHGCCFNMKYKDELIRSMNYLAKNDKTIFIGQSVSYSGNAIYTLLISGTATSNYVVNCITSVRRVRRLISTVRGLVSLVITRL